MSSPKFTVYFKNLKVCDLLLLDTKTLNQRGAIVLQSITHRITAGHLVDLLMNSRGPFGRTIRERASCLELMYILDQLDKTMWRYESFNVPLPDPAPQFDDYPTFH